MDIPEKLLFDRKISLKAKALYVFISYYSHANYLSIELLSSKLKEGKDSVQKGLLELKGRKWLRVTKTKEGYCIYDLKRGNGKFE